MGMDKRFSFILTYCNNAFNTLEMKDTTFIIILLLLCLVFYTGNKIVKSRSNEVRLQNKVNILESKLDSLKTAYYKLEKYTIDVENICDKYKSSRDAKYRYHLENKTINPL